MSQRSLFRDISGVFGSNLLALLNAFMVDIVLSRQLGPEGRGLYAAILVVPLIMVSFALIGIRRSAVYHLGKKTFDDNRTVSGVLSLLLITSVIAILFSGIAFLWLKPQGMTLWMGLITLLSVPVKLILVYTGGIYIGKEDFKRSNLQVWLPHFFNLLGILLFVYFIRWEVTGALLALFISNLVVALISLSYILKKFRVRLYYDKVVIKSLAGMGIVYALAVVVMQLNYRVDLILLQQLSTIKEVGYYSLGVAISDKLWQLPNAIGLVVMSRSANATDETALNRDVASLLRQSFLLVLFVAVLLWLIIPWLLPLLFGEQFGPSIAIVRWMLPGILMFVVVRILMGRFAGQGQPLMLIMVFVPALLINVLLNFLWIPDYGGIGAAWASNVSYSIGAVVLLMVFSLKMKIPLKEILLFQAKDFKVIQTIWKKISRS
ncbi:MAG: polysaccharide biosynthesis C-terminal domain-containing protein [Bacteroidales bacterium]|nr:polysaccharide biosynthesis C-terminal domain-containing protein [Bacteroidales bacterium]